MFAALRAFGILALTLLLAAPAAAGNSRLYGTWSLSLAWNAIDGEGSVTEQLGSFEGVAFDLGIDSSRSRQFWENVWSWDAGDFAELTYLPLPLRNDTLSQSYTPGAADIVNVRTRVGERLLLLENNGGPRVQSGLSYQSYLQFNFDLAYTSAQAYGVITTYTRSGVSYVQMSGTLTRED